MAFEWEDKRYEKIENNFCDMFSGNFHLVSKHQMEQNISKTWDYRQKIVDFGINFEERNLFLESFGFKCKDLAALKKYWNRVSYGYLRNNFNSFDEYFKYVKKYEFKMIEEFGEDYNNEDDFKLSI